MYTEAQKPFENVLILGRVRLHQFLPLLLVLDVMLGFGLVLEQDGGVGEGGVEGVRGLGYVGSGL